VLLTSDEQVVKQFLNGRKEGPIGMSEEKDQAQVEAELAALDEDDDAAPGVGPKAGGVGVPPQLEPSPGMPARQAALRRQARVAQLLHTLPRKAQEAIRQALPADLLAGAAVTPYRDSVRLSGQQPPERPPGPPQPAPGQPLSLPAPVRPFVPPQPLRPSSAPRQPVPPESVPQPAPGQQPAAQPQSGAPKPQPQPAPRPRPRPRPYPAEDPPTAPQQAVRGDGRSPSGERNS
jgi:hypothetical protein